MWHCTRRLRRRGKLKLELKPRVFEFKLELAQARSGFWCYLVRKLLDSTRQASAWRSRVTV